MELTLPKLEFDDDGMVMAVTWRTTEVYRLSERWNIGSDLAVITPKTRIPMSGIPAWQHRHWYSHRKQS